MTQTPVIWLDEIDSTNTYAAQLFDRGETGGPVWVAAKRQLAGRGRRSRSWVTVEGNLFASYVAQRPALPPGTPLHLLSLATGLALCLAAECVVGDARVGMKWPNDLLVDGAKAAGILLEAGTGPCGDWIVIGCGVNLYAAPEIKGRALGVVRADRQPAVAPVLFLSALDQTLQQTMSSLEHDGLDGLKALWSRFGHRIGERLVADLGQSKVAGAFQGLGPRGELLLTLDDGTVHTITSGDVGADPVGAPHVAGD
jgi:BirA family transcriptional regulator, biotin operon repressor / biotin---[acetyl-CoA-carboxylase] ligase